MDFEIDQHVRIATEKHMKILFSDKQIELIWKRLNGEVFNKTEREYYSRVIKKKLTAIASLQLHHIAKLLIKQ